MPVRRRRFAHGSRKLRQLDWIGFQFTFSEQGFDDGTCLSFWARWPSGGIDPQLSPFASSNDATLTRSLWNFQILRNDNVLLPVTSPQWFTLGLIAFDGGGSPDFWSGSALNPATSDVMPPRPFSDQGDDWILRAPLIFQQGNSYQGPVQDLWTSSKAQRKMPPDTGILLVMEFNDPLGVLPSGNFSGGLDLRMLIRSGVPAGQ